MKIAIPVIGFGASGGYRVLARFATEWILTGHEVTFLSYCGSNPPYFPSKAPVIWLDAHGHAVPGCVPTEPSIKIPRMLQALWRGLETHAAQSDIILANHSLTAWPVFLARVPAKKHYYIQAFEPNYYFEHRTLTSTLGGLLSLSSYTLPLKQILNSSMYSRYAFIRASDPVPPGIDLETFRPRKPAWMPQGNFIMGCIGRKEPNKGTRFVLQAFYELVQADPNVRLRVAYGSKLNLPKHPNLEIVEPTNDEELAAFYRSLDVLVSPVIDQIGAPHYPILEGLASGVPVISTGHVPATHDNAWFVPIRNAPAIAAVVREIRRSPETVLARVNWGLEDVKRYAWGGLANRMLERFVASLD